MRKLLTFLIAAIFSIALSASSFGGLMMPLGVGGSGCTNNLSIDGTPQVSQTTAATISVTFSTSSTNDVIVAKLWHNGGSYTGTPISDTAGLTWNLRSQQPAGGTEVLCLSSIHS
jgi:hypothetical protein